MIKIMIIKYKISCVLDECGFIETNKENEPQSHVGHTEVRKIFWK